MRNYKFTEKLTFSTAATMGKIEQDVINKVHSLSISEAKLANREAWRQCKIAISGTHETSNISQGKQGFYWEFVYDHNICEQIKKESYKVMMGYL